MRDVARRTLLACSGGADSCAMVLALCAGASGAPERFVVAHVVHDLRPRAEALRDRDTARFLARSLGVGFVSASVRVKDLPGNTEAHARTARYSALARLARAERCPFVATAHHADDALETLLMRLFRGAGPDGLAGVRASRAIGVTRAGHGRRAAQVVVVRPMLTVDKDRCVAICRTACWAWREDATNAHTALLRNKVRADVCPAVRAVWPGAAARAVAQCELFAGIARTLDRAAARFLRVHTVLEEARWSVPREKLARVDHAVRVAVLRRMARAFVGTKGADGRGSRSWNTIARAVIDREGRERHWKPAGLLVRVSKSTVTIGA